MGHNFSLKFSKKSMSEPKIVNTGGRNNRPKFRGRNRGRGKTTWHPVTHLGHLVQNESIKELGVIYRFSLCIKEYQLVDRLLEEKEGKLREDVMKIMPVQKQTTAGQRTRFK